MIDEVEVNGATEHSSEPSQILLKSRSTSIKFQLTTFNETLTPEYLSSLCDSDISVRLEHVERLANKFENTQSTLEELDISEFDGMVRFDFDMLYLKVRSKLQHELQVRRTFNSSCSTTIHKSSGENQQDIRSMAHTIRLPELQIPKFDGNYTEWPSFHAIFENLVHNNQELSETEKLQHLFSSVKGAAFDIIRSLSLSDANYAKALELLKKRFDNKPLILQAHVKEILWARDISNESSTKLRELSDRINLHMRALQTLGTKEQIADNFLIQIISAKLDSKSKAKWEEELSVHDLPTWEMMTDFLEKRCRVLENMDGAMVSLTPSHQVGKKITKKYSYLAANMGTISCVFCDSKDHYITKCTLFINLSPTLRYKEAKKLLLCLNCLRKGHALNKCKSGHCRHCASKHHSLLHMQSVSPINSKGVAPEIHIANRSEEPSTSKNTSLLSLSSVTSIPKAPEFLSENSVLLATAIILIKNSSGTFVPCRAILDSASQLNFITSRLVNLLQLNTKTTYTTISGIGDSTLETNKVVELFTKSHSGDYSTSCTAIVTTTITDPQPNFNVNISDWSIPNNITLADPMFFKSQRIDVLLGGGLFFNLLCIGQIRLENNFMLQKTRLGWIASGGGIIPKYNHSFSLAIAKKSTTELEFENEKSLNEIVKRFWEIENCFDAHSSLTDEDAYCETHFKQNFTRLDSGKYSVLLPKQRNIDSLGDSYNHALQRFHSLERKLQRNADLKTQYVDFINEYINLKHMSPAQLPSGVPTCFLPHHCVLKNESTTTKLRVVFDGSAKTSTGFSLNDLLMSGPTIQSTLFELIIRFRYFKIALCGDICKMYRCVRVTHPDEYLQCILWRSNLDDDVKVFKLDTVTYGTRPAAFLAIRAMHQLARDEEKSYPLGSKIVLRDFYVDDLMSGGDTVDEVINIRRQTTELLKKGGFQIRKWCSNNPRVLCGIAESERVQLLKFKDGSDITKALGLVWDPNHDNFLFSFTPVVGSQQINKRTVLSTIARFYDPIGLIGPIITKAKIFMQTLWKHKLHWDESLPQALYSAWIELRSQLTIISSFKFPRYVLMPNSKVQIHGFCDASLSAYGACIYIRCERSGAFDSHLLCSKSKVAPLKTLTVPKLELSAALLLSELIDMVVKTINFTCDFHCWSDSMVVLSWIREQPSNFNVFVSNRISKIQTLTCGMNWHHVPTSMNPADILSRGAAPDELLASTLWTQGPEFLRPSHLHWPQNTVFVAELPERRRRVLITTCQQDLTLSCKFANSFNKMQIVFAYIYRFVSLKHKETIRKTGQLDPQDIERGTKLMILNIQQTHFAAEYKILKKGENVNSSSKLYSLNPFIDSFGVIRIRNNKPLPITNRSVDNDLSTTLDDTHLSYKL
ncbi:uncharacterized protein LOC119666974 [Teleopsis dalmanni]|uniref:uncharacterized protein LOC119666974 n=1 Tax=Teleopsis dalmanni TaxID=139649 RepID=UPI0018CD9893|nr:uncharacterized protein LOC119666974 [Teleopsis dalmanni]